MRGPATEVVHVIDRLVATAPTVAPRVESAEPAAAVRRRRSEPMGMAEPEGRIGLWDTAAGLQEGFEARRQRRR